MIRVLVVDDHPIVRDGLVAVLEDLPDLSVVGSAGSADAALPLARRERPDVVLLDLEMPGRSGIEALPDLREAAPGVGVIVFTAYDTDERVLGAVKAGARGYLLKGATGEEIARAIRTVHGGGSVLAPGVTAKVLARVGGRGPAPIHLSEREQAVLHLIAAGLPNKGIAHELGIAERTVKYHATAVFNKLGADNRAQAVALAARHGLLPPDSAGR